MKTIYINQERLAQSFVDLVCVDSVSKEEGAICRLLQSWLKKMGGDCMLDDAGKAVGGQTGNLIAKFQGNRGVEPLLLSAHMDTVEPGRGIEPIYVNGIFQSRGKTILGADDKCGLAIIIEALRCIQESALSWGPVEVVFSICEEIGLQGAKHLDYRLLESRMGYVLDTRNPEVIITRAPAANRIRLQIDGKAAHAGAEPEKGISAIALAGQAIANIEIGRIDDETTCNLGQIQGGVATNIVPPRVTIHGEVRSHNRTKLDVVTQRIVDGFASVVADFGENSYKQRPKLTVAVEQDFDLFHVADDHKVVTMAREAADRIQHKLYTATSGGGSDANVFAQHGIVTGVLGTGCEKVHTVEERVALADMVQASRLLVEIIETHAWRGG